MRKLGPSLLDELLRLTRLLEAPPSVITTIWMSQRTLAAIQHKLGVGDEARRLCGAPIELDDHIPYGFIRYLRRRPHTTPRPRCYLFELESFGFARIEDL